MIDVTERPCRRHQDNDKQKKHYSGKKKHILQNLIMSTITKYIVFLGDTKPGRHHNYTLLKEAFPPEHPWFELITILVDLGFQGIKTDYVGNDIHLPYKKPRKSKANPNHLSSG